MYGNIYGMRKTTVYLPEDLKESLEHVARHERRTEAEIIREAIAEKVSKRQRPRPQIPLGTSLGDPTASERVDELLANFGGQ